MTAEGLRGLLDRGFVCSQPGIKIVSTYIEVYLLELLYVITNAFFNFGKQVCQIIKKRLPLDGKYVNRNKVPCSVEQTLRELLLPPMTIDQHSNIVIHIPH